MSARSLTIVLPAYNEEARLWDALDELFGYLKRRAPVGREGAPGAAHLPETIDVLVVDDGSTDRTAALVRERREFEAGDIPLRMLQVPHGGKGAAVRAGMLASTGEVAIFADADMATPPDQIPLLVEALTSADVVVGSRIQPDGSDLRRSQPFYRQVLGGAFHALASAWAAGPVRDTQCGFKGFSRRAADDLFSRQKILSIVFDVELLFLARRRGYAVSVIPIRWSDKRGSRMTPRLALALRVAWDLFRIPLIHHGVPGAATGRVAGPREAGTPTPAVAGTSLATRADPDGPVD